MRYRKMLICEDYNISVFQKSRSSVEFYLVCPPTLSNNAGHIALLLSVGSSTAFIQLHHRGLKYCNEI